ncbi:hypothetical protein [Bradyrhizobium sp. Ash2021]|uniref:hypothetical protein n=1 Tax=Bradyrhizobium sp. Ash2021 TaxID=2954771 RepID=UPI00281691E2|nr:hypothetical protein [Bradyrhizobium sp. Ash2021]WMT74517.1 hypothetical protein NL528_42700 [Bradyrhizobium sp. Ash2021]
MGAYVFRFAMKSDTATRDDIGGARVEYEEKVVVLVELNTTMIAARENAITEMYAAILVNTNPEEMAKA